MKKMNSILIDTSITTLLGEYVRDLRIEQRLSLRQLEELSGVSHTCIFNFEKGYKRNVTIDTLLSIACALDADISKFFVN